MIMVVVVQNNPNYKMRSPEKCGTHSTAQTTGLIFWPRMPRGNTVGGTVVIFEFGPPGRDIRDNVVT